ncbi:MAG TPA: PfkB family carbohydrate kinase [Phnomibacter sp.]|nr:PfkB family carbohydrate kinase [Phnomibacter sp.]
MYDQLFSSFSDLHIAVVGDVMLDTYWFGNSDRISPEAPVPVVAVKGKEYRIGGAGNVALNLKSLGAMVSMHTVTGTDEDGLLLELMMKDKGIQTEGVWKSNDRLTTNKIRIVSRSQHLLRLDNEVTDDLPADKEQSFIEKTLALFAANKPNLVIFEDYNKGVLTARVIVELINYCKQNNILTAVDPKRKNFFAYQGVDIFKPNLKEAREALNILDVQVSLPAMQQMHLALQTQLHHQISLVTLSEKGMFHQQGEQACIIPAHVRSIADVSGAGDTVIAVAAVVYAASGDVKLMAEMANIAGGLVCEEIGTVAIDAEKLLQECNRLISPDHGGSQLVDG